MINFAGSDPGSSNYGYTILGADFNKRLSVCIRELGMFDCMINNLTNKASKPPKSKRRKRIEKVYPPFPEQIVTFRNEWEDLMYEHSVVRVTSERFQPRGGGGLMGVATEAVNIMNGVICLTADDASVDYELITAATWKNQVNRFVDLNELYKQIDLTPHTIDSCFIGIHGAIRHFGIEWSDVDFNSVLKELKAFHK